ncbi:MAG: ATP synthase F0 subunit B [Dehalococcoidia bacterium]
MNTERPPNHSSLNRLAEHTVLEAEKLAQKLKEEANQIRIQAQAQASQIIAEAQTTAQEQIEAVGRVTRTASEEAQKIIQSARQKAMTIEAETNQKAEKLLEITKSRLEDQIRRNVKSPSDKLLNYVYDVVKEVQKLNLSLEHWEVPDSPGVELLPQVKPPIQETSPPQIDPPQQPDAEAAATELADVGQPKTGPEGSQEPVAEEKAPDLAESRNGNEALYEGALKVIIQAPVYPAGLGEVYDRLGKLQDITLRDTGYADDGSFEIDLSLRHPTPLLNILGHLDTVAEVNVGGLEMGGNDGAAPGETQVTDAQPTRIVVKLKS